MRGARDRNRTGTTVSSRGIFLPLRLSPLPSPHSWSGLSLCPTLIIESVVRQGPSSLYTFTDTSMNLYKYTPEQLRIAVADSRSMRQVLMSLHVAPMGGNYDVLRKAIHHWRLDTSHFSGQAWNRGLRTGRRYSVNDYLANKRSIQSYKLAKRLTAEGLLQHQCAMCGNSQWLDGPIPLELDHINGNKSDNELSNLRFLCPNCHALTPTYRSKNRSRLSSGLPPPLRAEVSPNLTPFTPAVSALGAQSS
jgi:5-methylcytosine-specific restriction endonuclease McrA